ncbi:hypothetical protein [Ferruginibacter sp.]|nr:hypothetical protein [Ferruginibacter sp.]
MRKSFLFIAMVLISLELFAQKYPEPEFSNEVYYLKKDSINTVIRLEKGTAKMESKTKLGGFGGSESGYELSDSKSAVRLKSGSNLSFVFSNGAGASSGSTTSSKERDSMMQANGMDPSMMQGMGGMSSMNDPANSITLYKLDASSNKRKVLLQKNPGMMPFGSKKQRSSEKYTFSVKKIKEGYWELVIDKFLPKGEYAFTMMNMMNMTMGGETLLFAFGID